MEHLYSVSIPSPILHAKHYLENRDFRLITSISNGNILAFTSNLNLLDVSPKLLGNFIYVIDLNLPYYPYKVTESDQRITFLEWNEKSTKLLVGKEGGQIEVWSMLNYLLSDWRKFHSYCISGDRVLSGIWFHRGIKLCINYDKKDSNLLYQDKFSYSKIGASVVQFGNKHTEGYLYITSSGFVYAHLTLSHGKFITGCELLNKCRNKIDLVDIAYMKNGSFLAIISNGNANLPFYCYKISVSINYSDNQKLNIVCQQFSSFTMNCSMNFPCTYPNVCFARFITKELPDSVLLVATGKTGSIIELWELREKNVKFHNIVENMIEPDEGVDNLKEWCWHYTTCTTSTSQVTALATPRTSLFDMTSSPSYIIVAYTDHSIKCYYRDNFQMLASVNLTENISSQETGFISDTRISQQSNLTNVSIINDLALSWNSCVVVGLDSYSQLHLFRLSPVVDPGNHMSLNFAQILLEYSLLSGNDYWDILISIKPQFIDSLCERITENFITRQTQPIQQKWLDSVLQLKTSMYRCVNSGSSTINYCKAGDCFATKMLNAISETIKRQIRAREFQDDEGPIERLALLVQNTQNDAQFVNIDKILPTLDNKDFYVEPSIQQSFLSLMQWVCDLSLYLLASIPQQCHQNQCRLPGAGLIFDPTSVNTIRELLVIIRFWSLIEKNPYLPSFSKLLDNLDVIALIYKLLTKIVIALSEKNVEKKIDDSIIDECCVLPNHVVIPQMDLLPKAIGIASPCLFSNSSHMALQYGIEPKSLEYNFKLHSIEGAINLFDNRMVDILRYVALGTRARRSSNIRSCTRCNSASLIKPLINKQHAARAWDQQWIKRCFCGGYWKIEQLQN